jgi:pimeloyl-ACP methyl ester carboxylesterase
MPTVQTGSASIWCDVHGAGRPLLLIPGLGATRFAWRKQIEPLAAAFHVLQMDNRDAGDSTRMTAPYSIPDMADDAAAVIRSVAGSRAVCVVGWSMGSFIAQALVLRHPALVERLMLVAGSAGGPTHVRPSREIAAILVRDPSESIEARTRRTYPMIAAPGYMDAHPEDLDALVAAQTSRPQEPEAYGRQAAACNEWLRAGAAARLPEIRVPTLVVHGDLDPLIPYPNGQHIAAHVPGARLSTYAGVGHLPPLEAADRFNREALDFFGR